MIAAVDRTSVQDTDFVHRLTGAMANLLVRIRVLEARAPADKTIGSTEGTAGDLDIRRVACQAAREVSIATCDAFIDKLVEETLGGTGR